VLGQAAISACRTTGTYIAARYRRLIGLRHSISVPIWHKFTHDM